MLRNPPDSVKCTFDLRLRQVSWEQTPRQDLTWQRTCVGRLGSATTVVVFRSDRAKCRTPPPSIMALPMLKCVRHCDCSKASARRRAPSDASRLPLKSRCVSSWERHSLLQSRPAQRMHRIAGGLMRPCTLSELPSLESALDILPSGGRILNQHDSDRRI